MIKLSLPIKGKVRNFHFSPKVIGLSMHILLFCLSVNALHPSICAPQYNNNNNKKHNTNNNKQASNKNKTKPEIILSVY